MSNSTEPRVTVNCGGCCLPLLLMFVCWALVASGFLRWFLPQVRRAWEAGAPPAVRAPR